MPVNVADNAQLSTFIMPSVLDRPPMQIAISTAGASPVLARKLRTMIEALVPFAFGRLAALAARFRAASKRRYPDPEARRRFWEDVYNSIYEAQALTYLRLLNLKLALVINFGERLVKDGIHRVVNGL